MTKIGDYVFNECFALEEVDIPSSVIEISRGICCSCSSLTKINRFQFLLQFHRLEEVLLMDAQNLMN